jgi:hypothetical protein
VLPVFDVRDLDIPAAVNALGIHRCVLLRHVWPPAWLERLKNRAQAAFELRNRQHRERTLPVWMARHYRSDHVLFLDLQALDAPSGPPLEVIAGFFQTPLPLLIQAYWRESFVINLASSVVRQQEPTHSERYTPWHQDGYFMDTQLPALNAWVPLQACGEESPGLEFALGDWQGLLPTQAPAVDVREDYASMTICAEVLARAQQVSPLLAAGDMLLFDHLIPHRTHATEKMTQRRTSVEIRLIPGMGLPPGYAGLPHVTAKGEIRIS